MQGLWNLIGKSGQGPGKDFNYDIGEEEKSELDGQSPWKIHAGKNKVSGEPVSVFVCDRKLVSVEEFEAAKNAQKRLRTLRHPNIIKYLDGFESEELVYLVTEAVVPLVKTLEDERDANLISWGIHQITVGLTFLLNDCSSNHDNINIFSVFVGVEGEWKLGGVEFFHASTSDPVIKFPYLAQYAPPEGLKRTGKEPWSADSWGLGCLIWEIYNGPLQKSSDLKFIQKIPKPLVPHYGGLVSANARSRTKPGIFLENIRKPGGILDNDFVKANLFLQEIQIKDVEEQKEFFTFLDKTINRFPKQFSVTKILPQLVNAFEYGAAGASVLSPLFKVGLLLDDADYEKKIVPCIVKLFSSNDRSTRIKLLQQMGNFAGHLTSAVVNNQIFPSISSGFGDTVPAMREQTIKAMLLLAPKLTEKSIDQMLRFFAKLQMDEQAGIRTNTSICLGKIAPYLSEATRKKILIPAFSRSLRDQFPPARGASIAALLGNKKYFTRQEIATKILPVVSVALVDQDLGVRKQAFRALGAFLKMFENDEEDETSSQDNVPQEENKGATWTSWAVSSVTSRLYQNGSEPQKTQPAEEKNLASKEKQKKLQSQSLVKEENTPKPKSVDGWDSFEDFSIKSIKSDLKSIRKDMEPYKDKNDEDSGSDYGDWDKNGDDGWEDSNDWQFDEGEKSNSATSTDQPSVASLLGMQDNNDDDFFGTTIKEKPKKLQQSNQSSSTSKKSTTPAVNEWKSDDGWDDGWNDLDSAEKQDEEDAKKKRRLENQKKREERKQQRLAAAKERKAGKSSGGMKLGAVKKVNTN